MKKDQDTTVEEAQPDINQRYTYSEYLEWDDDKRWELIDGVPFELSTPPVRHQEISGRLFVQLATFLKGKECEVFFAPFDVRLNAEGRDDTVVQPDLVVIFDKTIMMETGCKGPPDIVIEILSPSTSIRDKALKLKLYQKSGVREYWIVDTDEKFVHAHILDNSRYYINCYAETDEVPVSILEGCKINLAEVFEESEV